MIDHRRLTLCHRSRRWRIDEMHQVNCFALEFCPRIAGRLGKIEMMIIPEALPTI
jgi:hypothetical protein